MTPDPDVAKGQRLALRRVRTAARVSGAAHERLVEAIHEAAARKCSVRQLEEASGIGKSTIARWLQNDE